MAIITPIQEKKKQRYLLLILILSIIGIIFIFWYRSISKQQSSPRIIPEKPQKININYGILESKFLKALNPVEETLPLPSPDEIGRSNPFESF